MAPGTQEIADLGASRSFARGTRGSYCVAIRGHQLYWRLIGPIGVRLPSLLTRGEWRRVLVGQLASARIVAAHPPIFAYELRVAWVDYPNEDHELYIVLPNLGLVREWLDAIESEGVVVDKRELPNLESRVGRFLAETRLWRGVTTGAVFSGVFGISYFRWNIAPSAMHVAIASCLTCGIWVVIRSTAAWWDRRRKGKCPGATS